MSNTTGLTGVELEAMAVRELAQFHIDCSKYSLSKVEHDEGSSTLLTICWLIDGFTDTTPRQS
ncbi:hypothetical protein AB4Z32_22310 [Massilia sp. 2TAF26]|uniref:hypothetical protein n=1 Tax=Massilia sp. 2TAF26 TaxID=3233012 RepID=UPI003F9ACA46